MSFFVRAAVQALHQFPLVNAAIDGDDILTYRHMHIGIAVSSDRGLVVPVLRHAEGMTLQQIEAAIAEYGEKARRARLVPEDFAGRHLHHLQRRYIRLPAVDSHTETHRRAPFWACIASRNGPVAEKRTKW